MYVSTSVRFSGFQTCPHHREDNQLQRRLSLLLLATEWFYQLLWGCVEHGERWQQVVPYILLLK